MALDMLDPGFRLLGRSMVFRWRNTKLTVLVSHNNRSLTTKQCSPHFFFQTFFIADGHETWRCLGVANETLLEKTGMTYASFDH